MAFIKQTTTVILIIINAIGILSLIAASPAKLTKKVIFTKVDYDVHKDYITMDVILKNNTGSIPSVDLTADLLVDLDDNLYISSVLSRRSTQKNEYIALLKSSKVNLCEIFKRIDREPVHKFLIDTLKKSGNVPIFDCPVKKGHFYLQDFTIAGSDLPPIALAGEYKVEFAILQKIEENFVKVWRMVWYATIVNV